MAYIGRMAIRSDLRPAKFVTVAGAVAAGMFAVVPAHADTMPQLDFSNHLLVSQVVWGAIIFAAFYFLLARWGLPQVGAVLEQRAKTIGHDLDQARLAKVEADRAVADLNFARHKAYVESQAEIASATRSAKLAADSRAAALTATLDRQLAESEKRIDDNRRDAMTRLQDVATEATDAIVTRLVGHSADAGRVRDAVGQSMAERSLERA